MRDRLPFVIWTKETKSTFRMPNNENDRGPVSSIYNRCLLERAVTCLFTADEVNIVPATSSTVDWRSTIFRVNNAEVSLVYLQQLGYHPFKKSQLRNQFEFTADENKSFLRNSGPPMSDITDGIDFIYGKCKLTEQKVMVRLEGTKTEYRYNNSPSKVGSKFSHPNIIR